MASHNINLTARFHLSILLAITLAGTTNALAATDKCLSGASAATDASAIATLRSGIDAACSCDSFDGSAGRTHADYTRCALGRVASAIGSGALRKSCNSFLKKMLQQSTCGLGTDSTAAPCIERTAAGAVHCAIRTADKCQDTASGKTRVACPAWTNCVDAADTSGDLLVGAADSGECNEPPTTTTLPDVTTTTLDDITTTTLDDVTTTTLEDVTTTTLPETTTTTLPETTTTTSEPTTTTTLEPLCGSGAPVASVIVDKGDPDYEESVRFLAPRNGICPTEDPDGGGCRIHNNLDGAITTNSFDASASVDPRVCSPEDAALSYHWEILFPPGVSGIYPRDFAPWIEGWDSPVLTLPPNSLPLLGSDEGYDWYWRVQVTITEQPLPGEEISPVQTVRYFRFQYQASDLSFDMYNCLAGYPPPDGFDCAMIASVCSANPQVWCP